jgi:hypothetical protein
LVYKDVMLPEEPGAEIENDEQMNNTLTVDRYSGQVASASVTNNALTLQHRDQLLKLFSEQLCIAASVSRYLILENELRPQKRGLQFSLHDHDGRDRLTCRGDGGRLPYCHGDGEAQHYEPASMSTPGRSIIL